ncbi:MAG: phage terminase large subunit [Armatimonadetes bacterium]|nr:phage terminase large subunit [Armatimonadota bacterium]
MIQTTNGQKLSMIFSNKRLLSGNPLLGSTRPHLLRTYPHFPSKPTSKASSVSLSKNDYRSWLSTNFPHIVSYPLSPRHHRLWQWFDSLKPGEYQPAQVEPWPRGGAKSTTSELGTAYIGSKAELPRRYVLYVSETQDQADKHVAAIATLLEAIGIDRSLSVYGHSKGWKRNQLRTASGFNVESLGLDTAARGIKLDEFRPDLIIFDDIDNQEDNGKATEKKIRAITTSIIPAGSRDCCILFLQNLIIENGIMSQLVDGRADFLLDRIVGEPEPAVRNLVVETFEREDGRNVHRIVSGEPTWAGQDLQSCEELINKIGLRAFLRESQHEVAGADGVFFHSTKLVTVECLEPFDEVAIAFDIGATEGGGDYTVGAAVGKQSNDVIVVIDVLRGQWGSDGYERRIVEFCIYVRDDPRILYKKLKVRIPQDPGAAGKLWAEKMVRILQKAGFKDVAAYPVSKKKSVRARTWQAYVNDGNARLLKGTWNTDFRDEHQGFKEDESHVHDDQVDATSDAVNTLIPMGLTWADFL